MASTYSPNLRIELIGDGEQYDSWGDTTNTNLGTLIEDAIAGLVVVSVTSADQALTAIDGGADQARNAILSLTTTTTANFNVYAPPVSKLYVVRNDSAYVATLYNSTIEGNTTAAGLGVAIPAGATMTLWSNGVDVAVQNTQIFGDVTGNVTGDLTGNASTATVLQTARTINGVSFDGSQNITIITTPAGQIDFFAMSTAPTGYLKANGAAVSRTTYSDLFTAIGTTFGSGDGSTTFNVPDLRGEFVRGWDDGRGVDIARVFGSSQSDAIRDITGSLGVTGTGGRGGITSATGAFTSTSSGGGIMDTTSSFSSTRTVGFSASSVVPTADENRPRNVAMLACIKF